MSGISRTDYAAAIAAAAALRLIAGKEVPVKYLVQLIYSAQIEDLICNHDYPEDALGDVIERLEKDGSCAAWLKRCIEAS